MERSIWSCMVRTWSIGMAGSISETTRRTDSASNIGGERGTDRKSHVRKAVRVLGEGDVGHGMKVAKVLEVRGSNYADDLNIPEKVWTLA